MKVAVIGAGVMGPGIAQVFLMGGHTVSLNDISDSALQKGKATILQVLSQMQEKNIIDQAPDTYLENLTLTTDLKSAVEGAKIVIEVVPEKIELKKSIYDQLDLYCDEEAIIASNTSSLPLAELFPDFRKGSFCVAHFFNPPPIIPLVELVKNDDADPEKVAFLRNTLEACGKTVVVVNKFVKGFLINRLQTAMSREALYLYNEGIVSADDLNKAVSASVGFKSTWQGSFSTMDYIGLDTVLFVNDIIYPELCNDTKTPDIIRDKVKEGKLGIKTGEGFYKYDGDLLQKENESRVDKLLEQLKLWNKYNA